MKIRRMIEGEWRSGCAMQTNKKKRRRTWKSMSIASPNTARDEAQGTSKKARAG